MQNLLQETLYELERAGKTPEDVEFVVALKHPSRSAPSGIGSWAEFAALADFRYDDGYGGANINTELKVVGKDWWLERGEYDGSEWWEFKTLPQREQFSALSIENLTED